MKRKIILTFTGALILLFCFTTGVFVRDYYAEQTLRRDIHKIKVGMTERKVIQILGKPTNEAMSDIPGRYWYYQTNSFADVIFDGFLVLEMSRDGAVVKVFDIPNAEN